MFDKSLVFEDLIADLYSMKAYLNQETYSTSGRHHILEFYRDQMDERSNIYSKVNYGNQIQRDMIQKLKFKTSFRVEKLKSK